MKNIQNQTKLLLVGENLRQLENMLKAFRDAGFELLFAADIQEGFRMTRRNRPKLIISEFSLPGASGADLCRMIRQDINLCTTAFVFFAEKLESESLNEALRAGADDCFADFFTSQFFVAKTLWLIERKSSEEALNQHFQILRQNQSQILDIIKQTSDLINNMDYRRKVEKQNDVHTPEFERFMSKKLDLGLSMIDALANLMDDQVKALDIRESSFHGEPATSQEKTNDASTPCFYEISYN